MSIEEFKAMGKRLANHLASEHGVKLKHASILEAMAVQFGFKNWNTLAVKLAEESSSTPSGASSTTEKSYLFGTGAQGPCRISHQILSQHVLLSGERDAGVALLERSLVQQQIRKGGGLLHLSFGPDEGVGAFMQDELARAGRSADFLILDFDHPERSASFNPLAEGTVEEVVETLMTCQWSWVSGNDAVWRGRCQEAFCVLVQALHTAGIPVSFQTLLALVSEPRAFDNLRRATPELKAFAARWTQADSETTSLRAVMAAGLKPYATGAHAALLNVPRSEVRLSNVLTKETCLHIRLPVTADRAQALGLGRMLLEQLKLAVPKRGVDEGSRDQVPFLAVLQELPSYWTAGFGRLMSRARTHGVSFVVTHRTLNPRLPQNLVYALLGNTWNKVFFKQASLADAELASELIGSDYSTATGGAVRRVSPADLLGLPAGQAWVLRGPSAVQVNTDGGPLLGDEQTGASLTVRTVAKAESCAAREELTQHDALDTALELQTALSRVQNDSDIATLARRLLPECNTDPFWTDQARTLLASYLLALQKQGRLSVTDLLEVACQTLDGALVALLEGTPVAELLLKAPYTFENVRTVVASELSRFVWYPD